MSRFVGRDQFAAYNGAAPIEVSSGLQVRARKAIRRSRLTGITRSTAAETSGNSWRMPVW